MEATRSAIEALGRLNAAIARVGVWAAATLVAAMTCAVIAGVIARYVFNNSITWVEDVSLIMMVTSAFLVAPGAWRTGANVAIEVLIAAMPGAVLRVLRILINILVMWIVYRYFFESLKLVERGWGIRVNTVPIPWAYPYFIVPASFVAMALVGVELIARDLWGLMMRSDAVDLPHTAARPE